MDKGSGGCLREGGGWSARALGHAASGEHRKENVHFLTHIPHVLIIPFIFRTSVVSAIIRRGGEPYIFAALAHFAGMSLMSQESDSSA